jgi:CheY-like chemotaxis protein/nitrogen-specific signal transduction histidine kinase
MLKRKKNNIKKKNRELCIEMLKFQNFAEKIQLGIALIKGNGKLIFFNRKFKELLINGNLKCGQKLKNCFEKLDFDFIDKNKSFINWLSNLDSFKSNEVKFENFILEFKDGMKKFLNVLSMPLKRKINFLIFDDVTERIKKEEIINTLERGILHSKKLETIGLLTGNVVHDFSEILTVILGNAEIGLMKIVHSGPIYEIFSQIIDSAKQGSELILKLSEILQLFKIKSEVVNINDLINQIIKIPLRLISENIEIVVKLDEKLELIYVDPGAILNILMNLLVKYKDLFPSGGKLIIESNNIQLNEEFCLKNPFIIPGYYIKISMIFSHRGIDEIDFYKYFEKPLNLRDSNLNIENFYSILKKNNGYIFISGELGKVIRVDLYFPVYKEFKTFELTKGTKEPSLLPLGTILLVEDEEDLRILLFNFLKELGYKVILASDGEEAFQIFLEHIEEIDLLILDFIMPKMNGVEVFDKIKNYRSNLNCIFITGYGEEAVEKYLEKDNKVPIIKKPFKFKELEEKIKQIIPSRRF